MTAITAPSSFFFFNSSERTHPMPCRRASELCSWTTIDPSGKTNGHAQACSLSEACLWPELKVSPTQWLHCSSRMQFSFWQNYDAWGSRWKCSPQNPLKTSRCKNIYILTYSGSPRSSRLVSTGAGSLHVKTGFSASNSHSHVLQPCAAEGNTWSGGPMSSTLGQWQQLLAMISPRSKHMSGEKPLSPIFSGTCLT